MPAYFQESILVETNDTLAVPIPVSTTSRRFQKATFWGKKASRTNNTGTVWIGTVSANDAQPISITAGASVTIEAPNDQCYDLKDYYLDVETINDGVLVIYS